MVQNAPAGTGDTPIHIGTCAWSYEDWRGAFYPEHLPATERLQFYARHFPTVEVDSTFYHPPAPHVAVHWAEVTPDDFRFSPKLPREITHERKLRDWQEPLDVFLAGIKPLGPKLGAVLIQLPPYFEPKQDEHALRDFVRHLPGDVRFAVEFRDPAWHVPRIAHLLEEHAVCWAWNDVTTSDHAAEAAFGFWPRTTDFLYVRLLGDLDGKYHPNTGKRVHEYRELMWSRDAALANWAEKLRSSQPQVGSVFVYCANHFEGFSPATAVRLGQTLSLPLQMPSSEEMRGQDPNQLALF